ncbi:MAG: lipoyl(octanoyl) transferase LipB [Flavisolibacter sp.]|jgi:lipoyl(octanoyl) transferase|nr:lipoyl(octanoyl) transferase LipB [Flavisolibacter sp.]
MLKQSAEFADLGMMDYKAAWEYQEALMQKNLQVKSLMHQQAEPADPLLSDTKNYLLFVEHPPVYTLGKSGKMEHVLIGEEERINKGIQFFHTNRGGDITFHGPGQVVGYPIFDLEKFYTDIGRYLRALEEVMILTLGEYGIEGGRSAGETGVWLDVGIKGSERKICAMGVRCSRWITMHGFALNVNTDLDYFNYIIPCGIQHKKVTSLASELGSTINMEELKQKLIKNFENVFGIDLIKQ